MDVPYIGAVKKDIHFDLYISEAIPIGFLWGHTCRFAREGYVDHQTLSHDAYVKFIEDDFLGGRRLDPKTDGRPDPRESVAESAPQLGDLRNDFDFTQPPRAPVILEGGIEPPYKPGYTGPP